MAERGRSEGAEPLASGADKLRVFISYARTDASDFAEYLVVALKLAGFHAYLDRHDIAKAEDWEVRLGNLIAESDTVVFVITPASIKSPRCDWEVKSALSRGKRLVPVQWVAVPDADIPVELQRLNYTIFTSGQPFGAPLAELAEALRQDLGWLRQQTQLGEDAERWHARGRDSDLLLRGTALAEARDWMLRRKPNAPEISALINAFIGVSEEAQAAQLSEARKQLEERERLVADVEQAQQAREQATAEKLEASRRVVRRTMAGIVAALLLAALATVLYFEADRQRELVKEESERADQFVNLVSSHPAGRRAMEKICREAIEVTTALATTSDQQQNEQAQERFWELYYAPMYIIETHQRKTSGGRDSPIEAAMVGFGAELDSVQGQPLPHVSLCKAAKAVRAECIGYAYLNMSAPEPLGCS